MHPIFADKKSCKKHFSFRFYILYAPIIFGKSVRFKLWMYHSIILEWFQIWVNYFSVYTTIIGKSLVCLFSVVLNQLCIYNWCVWSSKRICKNNWGNWKRYWSTCSRIYLALMLHCHGQSNNYLNIPCTLFIIKIVTSSRFHKKCKICCKLLM